MNIFSYDGTFPGLLTVVFESYQRKQWPDQIINPNFSGLLFENAILVDTNEEKVSRVWEGIKKIGGILTCEQIYHAFLSNDKNIEMLIFQYLKVLFEEKRVIATNYSLESVLRISQLDKKVMREAQRMLMFARFEQAADGTWFSPLAPKYDVVPLVIGHFRSRFADQPWLIYDTSRNYGFYFNTKLIEQISINNPTFDRISGNLRSDIAHPEEQKWQEMWKGYFKQIAITERKNLKQHQNFMPKRFWKYLTEKKI